MESSFSAGQKFAIQPALNDPNGPVGLLSAPGYSYPFIGGDAQYVIIPRKLCRTDAFFLLKERHFI